MRLMKSVYLPAVALFAISCTQSSSVAPTGSAGVEAGGGLAVKGPTLEATVQFGDPNAGSPFPPTAGHDQSIHAADKVVPRTVVIDKGGTVTFDTFGVHTVAIYDDGTEPEDIDTSMLIPTPCIPPPLAIDDPVDRLAYFDAPCAPPGLVSFEYTFDQPGRYLVICAFLPHFEEADMYGWVIVRDR